MSNNQQVRDLIEPVIQEMGLDLYDLELRGSQLLVTVDLPPGTAGTVTTAEGEVPAGVDIDAIAKATRAISQILDEADPIPTAYTLEVSSPGLERSLRVPAHFSRALGRRVRIKAVPGFASGRRFDGLLLTATDDAIEVDAGDETGPVTIPYADIDKARTVFEWGAAPRPGHKPDPTGTSAGGSSAKKSQKKTQTQKKTQKKVSA